MPLVALRKPRHFASAITCDHDCACAELNGKTGGLGGGGFAPTPLSRAGSDSSLALARPVPLQSLAVPEHHFVPLEILGANPRGFRRLLVETNLSGGLAFEVEVDAVHLAGLEG